MTTAKIPLATFLPALGALTNTSVQLNTSFGAINVPVYQAAKPTTVLANYDLTNFQAAPISPIFGLVPGATSGPAPPPFA